MNGCRLVGCRLGVKNCPIQFQTQALRLEVSFPQHLIASYCSSASEQQTVAYVEHHVRGDFGAWLEAQLEVLAGASTPLHVDLSEGLLGLPHSMAPGFHKQVQQKACLRNHQPGNQHIIPCLIFYWSGNHRDSIFKN